MKSRDKIILLGLMISISFLSITPSIAGVQREATISTIAEKDSYVDSYNYDSNYGGNDMLRFGDYITGWTETYLYFNFTDKPAGWIKAEISIDMYYVSETFNVTVSLINDTWNEYTINWFNKPAHREVITTFTVAEGKIYKFDVSNYIAGRNNISICLNASNYLQNGYVSANSKEGYYWDEDAPQLIWTYMETAEITVTNPTSSSNWVDFHTYTIQWSTIGIIEKVKIELYEDTTFLEDITYTYTDNDGEYDFYMWSTENYQGTDYRIKISDYDDPNVYDFSDYFSINIRSGTITVTSPSSSTSWEAGSMHSISWTTTGNIPNVNIEIYKGNTLKYYINDVYNVGSKLWSIAEDIDSGTDWRVKIVNSDDSSQYDWSDYFEIYRGLKISGYNYYLIMSLIFLFSALTIRKIHKRA